MGSFSRNVIRMSSKVLDMKYLGVDSLASEDPPKYTGRAKDWDVKYPNPNPNPNIMYRGGKYFNPTDGWHP